MKHLAFIVSFFILSAALTPAVQLLHYKFSRESCEQVCSQSSCSDTPEDCEKQGCDPSFCCLKLQILVPVSYKNLVLFALEFVLKNNFSYMNSFVSSQIFDIWHPPKCF